MLKDIVARSFNTWDIQEKHRQAIQKQDNRTQAIQYENMALQDYQRSDY